ncbi:MAG TPA: two-component regulator propeller domain-containing protein, partial [Bacteroidales bacterium]|nr:two-component regulator propeller domain-containing protein [Bacteroidales bacterium]
MRMSDAKQTTLKIKHISGFDDISRKLFRAISVCILFAMILNPSESLFGINETLRIDDYSYKEGLTTSGVNSVYKDSRGFLWVCTNNGLFRYDGYSFKDINSLVSGYLKFETYCVVEDKNQNLW